MLDSTESDDERDIENIMNDSDTEFVAEYESVISTNIIRKEEIGDQSSSVSVAEASIHNFSTQNEGEIVGQDEWNSPPITAATTNVFPISQLLLPINVLLISHLQLPLSALPIGHLLLPLNVLLMSHLLLLLLDLIPISPSNLLLLLQLLYPKTPRNRSKAP